MAFSIKSPLVHQMHTGMQKKKKAPIQNDIDRINRNEWSRYIIALLFISAAFLLVGCLLDVNDNIKHSFWYVVSLFHIKHRLLFFASALVNALDDIYNLVISYNAILAAAVILFYSVMDNRKEGIPHRRIMSFAFGSKSIPTLFMVSMMLVPVGYVLNLLSLHYLSFIILVIVFIYQIVIICAVLLSTSYSYCLACIIEMEKLQFDYILRYHNEIKEKGIYVQTIFTRYIDIAMLSNELISDKMDLVRHILDIPLARTDWQSVSVATLYHFYYDNLEKTFSFFMGSHVSDVNILLDVLCEFVDRWKKESIDSIVVGEQDRDTGMIAQVLAVLSAFWNVTLVNHVEGAELFNITLLNKVEKRYGEAMTLYFLAQEFVIRRDESAVQIKYPDYIRNLRNWKYDEDRDIGFCYTFWEIWSEGTPLQEISQIYLYNALDTLSGAQSRSLPISFIMQMKNILGESEDEDALDPIQQ